MVARLFDLPFAVTGRRTAPAAAGRASSRTRDEWHYSEDTFLEFDTSGRQALLNRNAATLEESFSNA